MTKAKRTITPEERQKIIDRAIAYNKELDEIRKKQGVYKNMPESREITEIYREITEINKHLLKLESRISQLEYDMPEKWEK